MSKTRGLLLAVAVAAMAFTFSCSSGDDNNGGGGSSSSGGGGSSSSGGTQGGINWSDLPLVYDGELAGKIDVRLRVRYENASGYDTLPEPVGKIENGRLSLNNLPTMGSEYRYTSWDDRLDVAPQGLTYFYSGERPFVPDKNGCSIYANLVKSGTARCGSKCGIAFPVYNSASGTVTGTKGEETYDLNLSQGWQLIYIYRNGDRYTFENEDGIHDREAEYWLTTLPEGIALEWELRCN